MSRVTAVALTLLAPVAGLAQGEVSIQEALLRAKPAVSLVVAEVGSEVRLNCGSAGEIRVTPPPFRETGTGWFVAPSGWLLTNAHVVAPAHRPPEWLLNQQAQKAIRSGCVPLLLRQRGLEPGQRPDVDEEVTRQALVRALPTARVRLEPSLLVILANGLRLPARVVKYSPPVAGEAMSGQDLALLRLEASDMPALALGNSATARIGDRIHILGFPGVVLSHELLNASAKLEASVTNGAISGFKQDRAGQPVIQTDAPAAWGNSGGPAVNDRGQVVGVLTFVSLAPGDQGGIVQGFNFLIPVQAVRDFLQATEVKLDEASRFNAAWHTALREYFSGNHARAAKHFTEANRLLPELPDVRRLGADNADKIKNPPPRPFPWATMAGGVLAVSLAAFGGLGAAHWRRNRFRVRASEVMRLLEGPAETPLLIDARDDGTYARSPVRIPNSVHLTARELESGATTLPVEPSRTVVAYCT